MKWSGGVGRLPRVCYSQTSWSALIASLAA
jgi:hypothetical protein